MLNSILTLQFIMSDLMDGRSSLGMTLENFTISITRLCLPQ